MITESLRQQAREWEQARHLARLELEIIHWEIGLRHTCPEDQWIFEKQHRRAQDALRRYERALPRAAKSEHRATWRIPQETVEDILGRVPVGETYARFADIEWRAGDKEARGQCPACLAVEKSFSVNLQTGLCHCWRGSCDYSSNLIGALLRFGPVRDFRELITELAATVGVHLEEPKHPIERTVEL